jgi:regulator of RNase E activity RraA
MLYSMSEMREHLYCAVVCDALDQIGLRNQSPRIQLPLQTTASHLTNRLLVGRCKTTLWADMFHDDPKPYELELQAVDECEPDDVLIAAAGGSMRSGIWGELLTTAAKNRGALGAIVDGAIRDVDKIGPMQFLCVSNFRMRGRVETQRLRAIGLRKEAKTQRKQRTRLCHDSSRAPFIATPLLNPAGGEATRGLM